MSEDFQNALMELFTFIFTVKNKLFLLLCGRISRNQTFNCELFSSLVVVTAVFKYIFKISKFSASLSSDYEHRTAFIDISSKCSYL